jgi:hypothetical protein
MAEGGDLLSLEYALPLWGQEMPSPGALPNRSIDEGTLCVAQSCVTLLRDHEEKRDMPERLPLLRDEALHRSRIREAIRRIIQHLVDTQHECLLMMLFVTIQNQKAAKQAAVHLVPRTVLSVWCHLYSTYMPDTTKHE